MDYALTEIQLDATISWHWPLVSQASWEIWSCAFALCSPRDPTLLCLLMSQRWQSRFITNSLGSLEISALLICLHPSSPSPPPFWHLPPPLSDLITVVLNCPLLLLCLFLCEWSSACGSFCTNRLFNMPSLCQWAHIGTVLAFHARAGIQKSLYYSLNRFCGFFLILIFFLYWYSRFLPCSLRFS